MNNSTWRRRIVVSSLVVIANFLLTPVVPAVLVLAESLQRHNIEVCFVVVNAQDEVLDSVPQGSSAQIKLFAGVSLQDNKVNSLSGEHEAFTIDSSDILNRDVVNGRGDFDGYCQTKQYEQSKQTQYAYSQVQISGHDLAVVGYTDQVSKQLSKLSDVYPYSNEHFDSILGNESGRNQNADGHMILNADREYRHLIVVLRSHEVDRPTNPLPPSVHLNLENGAEYTRKTTVVTGVGVSQPVGYIRFGDNPESVEDQKWEKYSDFEDRYVLPDHTASGRKQLCVQLRNAARLNSNIACDQIILDRIAPSGSVRIGNSVLVSSTRNLKVVPTANDPLLPGSALGAGGLQVRFAHDNTGWTSWQNFQNNDVLTHVINAGTGERVLKYQFRDAVGNVSEAQTVSFIINAHAASSWLSIQDDAQFTNHAQVELNLGSTGSKVPLYVRFTQTEEQHPPTVPQNVSSPIQNQNGWTYWQHVSTSGQWDLAQPAAGFSSPNFGVKTVFAQYFYTDGTLSQVVSDSIIYAPYYAVEYGSVDHSSLDNGLIVPVENQDYEVKLPEYTIDNLPSNFETGDKFILKFKTKNMGSLTWLGESDHPVKPTSFWELRDGLDELMQFAVGRYRANSAELGSNVAYSKTSDTLELLVEVPAYPGEYKFELDLAHEGKALFSEFNNPVPSFNISVAQSPTYPIPQVPLDLDDDAHTGAYPANPVAGQIHVIRGYVRQAGPNDYNADYMIMETDGSGAVWYIIQHDISQYLGQVIDVPVRFTANGSYNFDLIGWDAQAVSYPTSQITLRPGDVQEIEVRYQNLGYHFWPAGVTRLGTKQPQDRVSKFYDSGSWLSSSRVQMNNANEVRYGDVARFRFNLKVPTNLALGTYTECFLPVVEAVSWVAGGNREICLSIKVVITPEPPVNDLPPLPPLPSGDTGYVVKYAGLDLLAGPNAGFPVVTHVSYGEEVTVLAEAYLGTHSTWLKIKTAGGEIGWVPKSSVDHVNNPPDEAFSLENSYIASHVCSAQVTVRVGPGTQYATKQVLFNNTNVRVLTVYNGWKLITLPNAQTGWVKDEGGICAGFYYTPDFSSATGSGSGGSVQGIAFVNGQVFSRPLNKGSYVISQGYHSGHQAIDYAASCGTPIFAAADGVVASAIGLFSVSTYRPVPVKQPGQSDASFQQEMQNYEAYKAGAILQSNSILINHANGTQSYYYHLEKVQVSTGQKVKRGQKIGTVGNTGWSTGCHLHFVMKVNGSTLNPEEVFQKGVSKDLMKASDKMQAREDAAHFRPSGSQYSLLHEHCGAWIKDYDYFVESGQSWKTYTNLIYNSKVNKALRLRGDIRLAYWDRYSGTCGSLGLPTTDDLWAAQSPKGTQGAYQQFDKGTIHSSYLGTFATTGRLNELHTGLGGTGYYGFPMGEMYKAGGRTCQRFEKETLCDDVSASVAQLFRAHENWWGATPDGLIHKWCGSYIRDYALLGGENRGAIIYNPALNKVFAMNGGVMMRYFETGDCDRYGLPTSDLVRDVHPPKHPGDTLVDWMSFEKATIVSYTRNGGAYLDGKIPAAGSTYAVELGANPVYRDDLLAGTGDAPYIDGYLGAPVTDNINHSVIQVGNHGYVGRKGWAFQGGWIVNDPFEGKYVKILDDKSLMRIANETGGDNNLGQYVQSFLEGVIEGVKGAITISVLDVLHFALSFVAKLVPGIGAVVAVAQYVILFVELMVLIATLGPSLVEFVQTGNNNALFKFLGALIGSVVAALLLNDVKDNLGKIFRGKLDAVKSVGELVGTLKAAGVNVSSQIQNTFERLSKLDDGADALMVITPLVKADHSILKRVVGSLDHFVAKEVQQIFELAGRGYHFVADTYSSAKSIMRHAIDSTLEEVKKGNYHSSVKARLNHVIWGDTGNPTSGLHHIDSLLERFKNGEVEVRIANTGKQLFTADEIITEVGKVTGLQFRKPGGNWPATKTTNVKTVFPSEWSIQEVTEAGQYFQQNAVRNQVEANVRPDLAEVNFTRQNGETVKIGGFITEGRDVGSWFLKK